MCYLCYWQAREKKKKKKKKWNEKMKMVIIGVVTKLYDLLSSAETQAVNVWRMFWSLFYIAYNIMRKGYCNRQLDISKFPCIPKMLQKPKMMHILPETPFNILYLHILLHIPNIYIYIYIYTVYIYILLFFSLSFLCIFCKKYTKIHRSSFRFR